jgi:hypothetical protein
MAVIIIKFRRLLRLLRSLPQTKLLDNTKPAPRPIICHRRRLHIKLPLAIFLRLRRHRVHQPNLAQRHPEQVYRQEPLAFTVESRLELFSALFPPVRS